jgi:hypothetical protein
MARETVAIDTPARAATTRMSILSSAPAGTPDADAFFRLLVDGFFVRLPEDKAKLQSEIHSV